MSWQIKGTENRCAHQRVSGQIQAAIVSMRAIRGGNGFLHGRFDFLQTTTIRNSRRFGFYIQ